MMTITVHQPYATLIVMGLKTMETRTWSTHYRGPLLIHASRRPYVVEDHLDNQGNTLTDWLIAWDYHHGPLTFPTQSILGAVNLAGVIPYSKLHDNLHLLSPVDKRYGVFAPGWCAWKLTNAVKFKKPLLVPGKQGLWEQVFDPDILHENGWKGTLTTEWQQSA